MIARTAALALAALAILPAGLSDAPAAPARAAPATQCRPAETVLYSCRFKRAVGSVCLGAKTVHYRYGPAGRPDIDVASDAGWSNVHFNTTVGGGGGRQHHVRFTAGRHDYVVFEAVAGNLTDVPGKRWSGINVARDGRDLALLECPGAARLHPGGWNLLFERAPASARDRLADEDPRFEGWY